MVGAVINEARLDDVRFLRSNGDLARFWSSTSPRPFQSRTAIARWRTPAPVCA